MTIPNYDAWKLATPPEYDETEDVFMDDYYNYKEQVSQDDKIDFPERYR